MMYEFMRVILLFDLPVLTKKDRYVYSVFRRKLISNGYIMLQYSVYCKLFNNRDSATKHISNLKKDLPKKGSIRILMLTEKQYSNMEILIGGKSKGEEKITIEPFMIL